MKGIRSGVALGMAALAGWLTALAPSQAQQVDPSSRAIRVAQSDATTPPTVRRPNILYVVADDLGWKDVGFNGAQDIKTPNIDQLAQGGARLEQFYVQPMCTPTRAALMTGRYPFRYGLQTLAIPASMTYGLPTDERLLPQMLKEAGYATAIIGKWHLGHSKREYWPMQRGFDYQYGAQVGEIDYFTHMVGGKTDWYRNNKQLNEKGYVTTLLGDDAVRFIDRYDASKPLFLYLAFTAPHAPYQAPQEYLDRYRNISDPNRRAYAAMVAAMDDQIGRVVRALEKRGMRQNTLIVFHSDNGGNKSKLVSGESDVKGELPADNGPWRGGKGDLYEGGVRVPSLVNWPGQIKPGTVVDQMIHIVDYYPTIARLAGATTAKSKPLDGLDVWPTIKDGQPTKRDEVIFNVEAFRGAVRKGDWKLVWRTTLPSKLELFNLSSDPYEKTNLAEQNPQKTAELQKRVDGLASEMARSLLLSEVFQGILKGMKTTPPALPNEEGFYQQAD